MKGNKNLKMGGYSILVTLIAFALIVLFNIGIQRIPSRYTKFDLSREQLSALSDQSVSIARSVECDVTLYWIVREGTDDTAIGMLLERYSSENSKIRVVKLDPDESPTLRQTYGISLLYNNSVIVESELRYRYISYNELYVTEYDYENYDPSVNDYATATYFAGEQAVTSAVHYVSTDEVPKAYILSEHGEAAFPDRFTELLKRENIETENLSLLSSDAVPADADLLILHSPEKDLSAEEAKKISAYLRNGGKLFVTTHAESEQPNLTDLLSEFGLEKTAGMIMETPGNYFSGFEAYYLLPEIKSHEITDPLLEKNFRVLVAIASGIRMDKETLPDGVTVSPLLVTSAGSYLKADGNLEIEKQEGDEDGPFCVAAIAERETEDPGRKGVVFWASTGHLTNEYLDDQVNGTNYDLISNSLNYLTGDTDSISIAYKKLAASYFVVNARQATFWTILLAAVIPALILGAGLFVMIRRARR